MNIAPIGTWTSIMKQKPSDPGMVSLEFLELPMLANLDRLTLFDSAIDTSPSHSSSVPLLHYLFPVTRGSSRHAAFMSEALSLRKTSIQCG